MDYTLQITLEQIEECLSIMSPNAPCFDELYAAAEAIRRYLNEWEAS